MTPDELAVILCQRMLTRTPVWVAATGEEKQIISVFRSYGYEEPICATASDTSSRPVTDYLLDDPRPVIAPLSTP